MVVQVHPGELATPYLQDFGFPVRVQSFMIWWLVAADGSLCLTLEGGERPFFRCCSCPVDGRPSRIGSPSAWIVLGRAPGPPWLLWAEPCVTGWGFGTVQVD